MHARRTAVMLAAATAVAIAPLAAASAHTKPTTKPDFVVSGVHVVGHHRVFNVNSAPASVQLQVKIRDFSTTLDPAGVTLTLREKVKGQAATTFDVTATETASKTVDPKTVTVHGKSHTFPGFVVTTWTATVDVQQGAVAEGSRAWYGVTKIAVDPSSATVRGAVHRPGHHHRCFGSTTFLVVNRAPKV
ncbi:MAG TPA: hypothetical protein VMI11_06660 [Actinomycetes bacterium]|nr:hypothetical protein [Actinomycetes bacterium]